MERHQIRETPSIPMPDRQGPISQGKDVAWHQLPFHINWRRYVCYGVAASALLLTLFVMRYANLANLVQFSAAGSERIAKLTAAMGDTPYNPSRYWRLGDAYFDQEDYPQALANYHRYLELVPDKPPLRLLQRLAYLDFQALTK